jgi:peptidyl-prolyl cis-trans isomerase SurA
VRLSTLLPLGVLLARPLWASDVVDRVVAIVNKDIVLLSDVEALAQEIGPDALSAFEGDAAAQELALHTELLESLIAEKLVDQAMERAAIAVTEEDVDSAVADVAAQNGLSVDRLYEELMRQGLDRAAYRAELKEQLEQYKFMNLEIRGRVHVSEDDARQVWQQTARSATPDPAWQLQRILLAFPAGAADADRARIRTEAQELLQRLAEGKPWEELAALRSDDVATKAAGGEAGLFRPKELSAAFSSALAGVPEGQAVAVEAPTGIFLLRVRATRDLAVKPFDEVKGALMRQLWDQAAQREMALWTEEERARSHVVILP